jgi:hypothetical protein
MPKSLKEETVNEVDGSPLVYNAFDYNRHHREIRAIQCYLIGAREDSGFENMLADVEGLVSSFLRVGMTMMSGAVPSGTTIPIPAGIPATNTSGTLSASATSIPVVGSEDYPQQGFLTKFNALRTQERCSGGGAPGAGDRCPVGESKILQYGHVIGGTERLTLQEIIQYNGLEDNTFLNCVRGFDGSSAQDVEEGEAAIIIPGRASLTLTPHSLLRDSGNPEEGLPRAPFPYQFIVENDATLNASVSIYEQGSRQSLKDPMDGTLEVGYSWVISPNFESLIGLGELACLL